MSLTNGTMEMKHCVDYAQLFKTLCIIDLHITFLSKWEAAEFRVSSNIFVLIYTSLISSENLRSRSYKCPGHENTSRDL